MQINRRAFCATVTGAVGTVLSVSPFVVNAFATTPVPDAKIVAAVAAWLDLSAVLTGIMQRRDDAFEASRDMVGECPHGDVEANNRWHDAWNLTLSGQLEWEWDRVAAVSDRHLTFATNTRATTPEGIAAKIKLYRAVLDFYENDEDDYMLDCIERDIAALSHGEA